MKKIILLGLMTSAAIWAAGSPMVFSNFDANSDGKVTQEEFQTAQAARMTARANEGRQMKNAANAGQFADIDMDKNGVITEREFQTFQQKHMKNNQGQGMHRGQGKGQGKGMHRGQGKGQGKGMMRGGNQS